MTENRYKNKEDGGPRTGRGRQRTDSGRTQKIKHKASMIFISTVRVK